MAPHAGLGVQKFSPKLIWHDRFNEFVEKQPLGSDKPLIIAGNFEAITEEIGKFIRHERLFARI